MKVSHTKLKSGLQLFVVPMPSTETVTVLVLVRAGSKYENRRINGISHFLEHMFFKGTSKRPSPLAVAETLDRVGGEYNAFTGKESTGYYAKVDAKHVELAIDWVSDMLLNPLMKADEIEREKGVIAQEINMYYDTPMSYVEDVFEGLLYGDQPAGWDIAGTKEIISKFNRKDFLTYLGQRYVANETFVIVAGNVQSSAVQKNINKYFGALKAGRAPKKLAVKEAQRSPQIRIHKKDTDQTHFHLGVRAFDAYDERRWALSVLATILGGNMSSRLFMSLREERGLAYYVSTRPDYSSDTGYISTQAGVPNKDIVTAVEVVLNEYDLVRRNGVTEDELQKAKDYFKGKLLIGLESSSAVASFFGDQAMLHGKVKPVSELVKKIEAVTTADIKKVAQTVFKNDKLNLALIGPGTQAAALKRVLKFKK